MNAKGWSSQTSGQHPLLSNRPGARAQKGKVVSAAEAVQVIRDGDTVGEALNLVLPSLIEFLVETQYNRFGRTEYQVKLAGRAEHPEERRREAGIQVAGLCDITRLARRRRADCCRQLALRHALQRGKKHFCDDR